MIAARVWIVASIALTACPDTSDVVDAGPQGIGVMPSTGDPSFITDDDRRCDPDEACTIVQSGCCPCNSNGTQTAVRADAKAGVDERLNARCVAPPCSAALSNDETCCADRAECIDGQCELIGPRGAVISDDCLF